MSLLDWLALTSSLGWASTPCREASEASTSFMFMLELVPDPVWKTSTGNSPSCSPATTWSAPATIASATSSSSTSSRALTRAAAALTSAIAWMWSGSSGVPLIGKFSTARWVCARHSASLGTSISPMLSCSTRISPMPAPPHM